VADRNPYVIGVPLTNDASFYGRQDFFNFIKDVLDAEKQNVIVLYGQRRIGKTSVLHRAAKWIEDQGSFFPVYYDLQGKERLNLGEVLENLAHTLARRLDLARPDAALFDDEGSYFGDRFLPLVFERLGESRLVLLVDEFDVLSDEIESPRAASKTLFPYLQDLIVTRPQIGFVFVVGRRIEELATHFQAIFKQAVYRRVGHLKPEDSRALIVEPARGMITYSDDAVRQIQNLAAGHPYITQLICFEVFNALRASGQTTVTADVVNNVVNSAIESGHGALNWFWEGLPRAERFILSAVAQVSDESAVGSKEAVRQLLEDHHIRFSGLELNDAPDRLVEWEMLRREGPDAYQFVVEIVRRWVIKEHPLSSARRDIDYVSKRAVRLYENARDAHSEGDLPYARDEYRRTLKANPNHSGAQLGLALVLFELGEIDEAIVEFERAYAIDEMSARDGLMRARLAKGKALEEQDLIDNAVAQYEQVLQLAPAEETALRRMGAICQCRAEALLSDGDLAGAGDAFRATLKYDHSRETLARMQTALIAHVTESEATGDVEQGTTTYILLTELIPDREDVIAQAIAFGLRSGEFLEANGRLDDAIILYTKVMALFPGDANISEKLDSAMRKLAERQTVDRVFEDALGDHRSGNMDRAREGFKKLILMDVLSYKGNNIATLLAETIGQTYTSAAANTKPQPEQVIESQQDPPAAATENQRELPLDREPSADGTRHTEPFFRPVPADLNTPADKVFDRMVQQRKAHSWRAGLGFLVAVTVVAGLAWLIYYLNISIFPSSPPPTSSVIAINLPKTPEVRANSTFDLSPEPSYDGSLWYQNPSLNYQWSSSDEVVAMVSAGTVIGVSPGTARITASYGGAEGYTDVTVGVDRGLAHTDAADVVDHHTRHHVSTWDIPSMKANVTGIRCFSGLGLIPPEPAKRNFKTQFDSRTTQYIWAQLELHMEKTAKDRAFQATISYTLSRGDGFAIKTYSWTTSPVDPNWPDAWVPIRLDLAQGYTPGTYHIEFKHDGKVIGTVTFVVV
jgi:tetratricopeptide (TPR) repeat protein